MKKQLIGLGIAALMFGGVGSAGGAVITPDNYQLEAIGHDGDRLWGYGKTDFTMAHNGYVVDPDNDLQRVDSLLSDGYQFSPGEYSYENINGIYTHPFASSGYAFLDFSFNTDTIVNTVGLQFSRVRSQPETPIIATTYLDGTETGTIEFSRIPYVAWWGNPAPPPFVSLDFGSIIADKVRLSFFANELGLHEVRFEGVPTPTPEPATMLLFGTGLVGLVGSRLRKKKQQ